YRASDGVWTALAKGASSGFIPAKIKTIYSKSQGSNVTYWDKDLNFVSGADTSGVSVTVPNNPDIKYLKTSMVNDAIPFEKWMLVEGEILPSEFISYHDAKLSALKGVE